MAASSGPQSRAVRTDPQEASVRSSPADPATKKPAEPCGAAGFVSGWAYRTIFELAGGVGRRERDRGIRAEVDAVSRVVGALGTL